MGDGEPVAPEEDIPPEMFEQHNIFRPSFTMFDCNWVLVLENTMDAHNAFMVHRNAPRILKSRLGGRPGTPLGYRVTLVREKNVHYRPGEGKSHVEKYYEDENGVVPYQMYYPGVDGVWPCIGGGCCGRGSLTGRPVVEGRCPAGCRPGKPTAQT